MIYPFLRTVSNLIHCLEFGVHFITGNDLRSFKQISGKDFKSKYKEHIRISERFDVPGSLSANIFLHDGYSDQAATANLELMTRRVAKDDESIEILPKDDESKKILSRPVIRKNSTATGNTSRNFTHPVVFLSLKRLYPIADREYKAIDFDYLKTHEPEFIALTNELLNRSSTLATGTHGTITSAVPTVRTTTTSRSQQVRTTLVRLLWRCCHSKNFKLNMPTTKGVCS